MIKSEPRTILQFLATHFDLLRELYDIQVKDDVILNHQVLAILEEHGNQLKEQLENHKFLVRQQDEYIINEPYYKLFEFVLQQFKPLLPEEIEKFGYSIRILFQQIKAGLHGEKNILLDRIERLSHEIKTFTNAVTNNTISLLNESRELKANTQKIDYQEKVSKARYWIEHYILPLNEILNVNHAQSIYNELLSISQFANQRRFDYGNEEIRKQFEKLYNLLKQTTQNINEQSAILTTELLPLIERIKTESEILKGMIFYLQDGKCYKSVLPPRLLEGRRTNVYQQFIFESTVEYFDRFKNEEAVLIIENNNTLTDWIFDKTKYKSSLEKHLPVEDFFGWCASVLKKEKEDFTLENYFMLTSLFFEDEFEVSVAQNEEKTLIKTQHGELILPKLKMTRHED